MKALLTPLYDAWMKFAHVLGWINGRIILTVLYIIIIGPYAIIRTIGMLFYKKGRCESYWVEKEYEEPTLVSLRRTF